METAERTQPSFLAELDSGRETGVIREVKPYWLINAVSVVTTVDALADLAARDAVDVIEPHLVVEPIDPILPDPEKGGGVPRGSITPGVMYQTEPQPFPLELAVDPVANQPAFARLAVYGASVRSGLWGGVANLETAYHHSFDDDAGDEDVD